MRLDKIDDFCSKPFFHHFRITLALKAIRTIEITTRIRHNDKIEIFGIICVFQKSYLFFLIKVVTIIFFHN